MKYTDEYSYNGWIAATTKQVCLYCDKFWVRFFALFHLFGELYFEPILIYVDYKSEPVE